ncbi:MAG: LysM peptidoglycan-binding domain-containing protein [Chloroflexi bacterium]|nr:LysM peptidoglycan-binding domain-containing protein [Chloroflexota bacterium]
MSRNTTLFLIIGAILFAVVTVGGILIVSNRNRNQATAEPTIAALPAQALVAYPVTVGDQAITLQVNDQEQVRLIPLSVVDAPVEPVPTVATVVEPPVVEQPTAVPATDTQPPPAPTPTLPPLPTAAPPPVAVTAGKANFAVAEIIFITYTIIGEDTLYRLTEKYATSIELMARNGISSDNFVVGNTISLPIANPDRCPGMRPYIVREKDTVYRIANAYGTTPTTLRDINGLNEAYAINVTQVLCIP